MKTHILQLERHDDTTSVIDKIHWSKASRILLVWPRRGRVLTNMLDLLVIQRASQNIGAQLACVADDDDVLDHAHELGIPVFRSSKAAEKIPWRKGRHKKSFEPHPLHPANYFEELKSGFKSRDWIWWQNQYVRQVAFALGIMAVIGLLIFLLPRANVKLALAVNEQSVDLQVWASPDLHTVNLSGGVPAALVSTIVESTETAKTTGSIILPDQSAMGKVEFKNLTDQRITIPSGTVVQTIKEPIIQFRTLQAVVLEPQPGAQAEVGVQAVQAGSQGNVRFGEIQAVIGSLGTMVSVMNNSATLGGTDISTGAASKSDLDQLREHMVQDLQETALQELEKAQNSESRLLTMTLKMVKLHC
jgi:hypothetical protein